MIRPHRLQRTHGPHRSHRARTLRAALAKALPAIGLAGLLMAPSCALHRSDESARAPRSETPRAEASRPSGPHAEMERSLERFAASWIEKQRSQAAYTKRASNGRGGYRGVGDDFATRLKPTGNPKIPFVGTIRYQEHEYACQGGACSRAASHTVTEIFRYQDGRWVY